MTISSTYGTWTTSWPWPRVFYTGDTIVAAAMDEADLSIFELYNSSDTWYAERLGVGADDVGAPTFPLTFPITFDYTGATIRSIDVAGFGPFYLLSVKITDGEPHCWYRDVDKSVAAGALTSISGNGSIPRFRTACNFKGQIVIGELYSGLAPWNNLSQCSVAWSGIGQLEFDPDSDKTAGFVVMPWDDYGEGKVYKLRRLGNLVVVYGDGGRAILKPHRTGSSVGFGLQELTGAGISSINHMAGDYNTHCFMDRNYDVWIVTGDGKFRKLGYREWMSELVATGDEIILSYSPQKKLFYFSDGNQCFVLSEFGMGECNQLVTSIVDYRGIQAGFFETVEDYEFRMELSPLTFGTSSLKTMETLDFMVDYIKTSGTLSGGVNFKYDYDEAFRTGDWLRLSPQRTATPNITASEFKVKLKGTDYRSVTRLRIKDCRGTFKFSDKRAIRGMYASKDFA